MWRKVAYTVKVHTDVLLYSAYHTPVNSVKMVASSDRKIRLRKNNGISHTGQPGVDVWLGAFPARTVWWLIRKAFSERECNGIRDKHRLQKRDNSSLSGPSDGTKLHPKTAL